MSAEQRDDNLGIDSDLRNRDPLAYELELRRKLEELTRGLIGEGRQSTTGPCGSPTAAMPPAVPRLAQPSEEANELVRSEGMARGIGMGETVGVVFLDGLGCNPDGFKPRFIAGLGYRVTAPILPDLDFPAAVAEADRAIAETRPGVIVGYSRGAGVALMTSDRVTPRLLIAPSLRWVADGRGFDGRLVILHSATDDGLPLETVQAHLDRCGLVSADLRIVGADHTMIDSPALAALEVALSELAKERHAEPLFRLPRLE